VVKAEQSNQSWNRRIEHVLGASDKMPAGEKRAQQIDNVKGLEQQKRDRLPGEKQPAFSPKRDAKE